MKINYKDDMKSLLIKYPDLRDDNLKTIFTVWAGILKGRGIYKKEMRDFLQELLQLHRAGILPSPETITRNKRKIQEEYPELDGDREKKNRQQERFKKEFGNNQKGEI